MVNGLPIGPGAVKIFIDAVVEPETFLWRPTPQLSTLDDCLKSFVAWPVHRVIFYGVNIDTPAGSFSSLQQSASTPSAPIKKTQVQSQSSSQSPTLKSQVTITLLNIFVLNKLWFYLLLRYVIFNFVFT